MPRGRPVLYPVLKEQKGCVAVIDPDTGRARRVDTYGGQLALRKMKEKEYNKSIQMRQPRESKGSRVSFQSVAGRPSLLEVNIRQVDRFRAPSRGLGEETRKVASRRGGRGKDVDVVPQELQDALKTAFGVSAPKVVPKLKGIYRSRAKINPENIPL